jgi:hypothetical protein
MSVKICPNGRNDIHGSASLPIIHGSDRRPCLYIPNMNFKTGNEIYPRHSRTQIPISPTNSPIAALWVGAGCVEAASCRLFLGCVGCHLDRALRREIKPSSVRQYGRVCTCYRPGWISPKGRNDRREPNTPTAQPWAHERCPIKRGK